MGKWVKGKCSNTYKFICQTELENFPSKCSSSYTYKKNADKCYKVNVESNSWSDAEIKCDKSGGNLAVIRSETEQKAVTETILNNENYEKKGYWIGLTDHDTMGTLTWIINQDQPSYQHWAFGEPSDQTLASFPGGTCGFIDNSVSDDFWSTTKCGELQGFVCEHEPGKICPDEWTYYKSDQNTESCLYFVINGHELLQWWSARQYCDSIGSNLFLPTSEAEQNNLSKYYSDWSRAGITRLWIGVESKDSSCQFSTWDGRSLYYEGWESDQPKCETEPDDDSPFCVYMNTLAAGRNWQVGDCYNREAFACQVQVGQKVHEKPVDQSDYYCTQDDGFEQDLQFKLYEDDKIGHKCFMFLRDVGELMALKQSYRVAEIVCESLDAQIATIHSPEQNAWIHGHTNKHAMWLGSSGIQGKVPTNWDNGETMDFTAFFDGQPNENWDKEGEDHDCLM